MEFLIAITVVMLLMFFSILVGPTQNASCVAESNSLYNSSCMNIAQNSDHFDLTLSASNTDVQVASGIDETRLSYGQWSTTDKIVIGIIVTITVFGLHLLSKWLTKRRE